MSDVGTVMFRAPRLFRCPSIGVDRGGVGVEAFCTAGPAQCFASKYASRAGRTTLSWVLLAPRRCHTGIEYDIFDKDWARANAKQRFKSLLAKGCPGGFVTLYFCTKDLVTVFS